MNRAALGRHLVETRSNSRLSNQDLFVKNIRLLDLDEDFDWPGIDAGTFSIANGKENLDRRLYCAVWIFYKLFELYDKEETRRTLREQYPPVGLDRQSLLGGLIFRWLYKLKLAGFFSKEIVVRKNMFDDCKGSKFEELLAVFSTAVLIQVVNQSSSAGSIVQRSMGLAVLPMDSQSLVLAYQASLNKLLRTRAILERRWLKFARSLKAQSEPLEQYSKQLQAHTTSNRISQKTLLSLHKFVREQWTGNSQWTYILLQGSQNHSRGGLLDLSYGDVWHHACNDTLYAIRPQQDKNCMQSLENALRDQRSRLSRWKTIQTILAARKQGYSVTEDAEATPKAGLPGRKYSLRSHAATTDDSCLSQDITRRNLHHRSSKSVSYKPSKADTTMLATASTNPKPMANTGVRLSTTAQLLLPQDHRHSTSTRPIPSRQIPADTSVNIHDESDIFSNGDNVPTRVEGYDDPYTESSAYRPSLSLAERTKLSMAGRADNSVILHTHDHTYEPEQAPSQAPSVTLNNLAQRTKQSMLTRKAHTTDQGSWQARKPRSSTTHSIDHTVNPRAASIADETFFDETIINLDKEDIFKSRPKVAVSPVLTPLTEGVSLSAIAADDSYEDDFS